VDELVKHLELYRSAHAERGLTPLAIVKYLEVGDPVCQLDPHSPLLPVE
jgi:hypothetical protein